MSLRCQECGREYEHGYDGAYCCRGCYEKAHQREKDADAVSAQKKVADLQAQLMQDEINAKRRAAIAEEKAKKQAKKEQEKEKKEAKKADMLEKAKVTSSESLSRISRLCLTMGFLGVHRFAVGKFISGIAMPAILVFGIMMAITERDATMLAISAADIVWWLFDFATIKAKKFTDKFGNTIKEN